MTITTRRDQATFSLSAIVFVTVVLSNVCLDKEQFAKNILDPMSFGVR